MTNLDSISLVPKKKRPVKVLQFGTGNFLRGFADWMIEILNEKTEFDGSIHIIQSHGKSIPEDFVRQNFNYHVFVRGFQNGRIIDEYKLVTSVSGVSNPNLEYGFYLDLAKNPDLEFIISNTTEAGIVFDEKDTDPKKVPALFPGKLAALLYERFTFFEGDKSKTMTILPCELIENNGDKLKECVIRYSALWNFPQEFLAWIDTTCTFCNTLVDRIVPGFPKENIEEFEKKTGFRDQLAVVAEPYHFWAIEGPEALKAVFQTEKTGLNVHIVEDLQPYRLRKVRILNGAHTAMVPVAYLRGIRTVGEAMEDPEISTYISDTIYKEIIPTLDLPKEELEQFAAEVLDRFRNPFIRHELISISLNSISKFRVRVLPTILEYHIRTGQFPENLIRSFADLIRFYKGDFNGEYIPLKDESAVLAFFKKVWKKESHEEIVETVLANEYLWGMDLNQIPALRVKVNHYLKIDEN
ncbi:tagaturonate reductase [Aquiflexum gelatinilyticum]|uniref:tagaturonate reductase n=1 Tax=Aquiflexum gelatinilyticum TaxID=2961943 RepID=UPI00216A03E1|nr:tagaturonate reductase [Aquiflexum gelatinilyticum]MCS4432969.1 tagaturonate reductase [Aquiflexum gelatinilyticum]